jgi:hypothetical protein
MKVGNRKRQWVLMFVDECTIESSVNNIVDIKYSGKEARHDRCFVEKGIRKTRIRKTNIYYRYVEQYIPESKGNWKIRNLRT